MSDTSRSLKFEEFEVTLLDDRTHFSSFEGAPHLELFQLFSTHNAIANFVYITKITALISDGEIILSHELTLNEVLTAGTYSKLVNVNILDEAIATFLPNLEAEVYSSRSKIAIAAHWPTFVLFIEIPFDSENSAIEDLAEELKATLIVERI